MPWTPLTEDLIPEIAQRVKGGLWPEIAAQGIGVRPQDWTAWAELGERLSEVAVAAMYETAGAPMLSQASLPDDFTEHERLSVALVRAVDQAEAECEARWIQFVVTETARGRGAWRAVMWLLERRFPERWGKRVPGAPPERETLEDYVARFNRGAD